MLQVRFSVRRGQSANLAGFCQMVEAKTSDYKVEPTVVLVRAEPETLIWLTEQAPAFNLYVGSVRQARAEGEDETLLVVKDLIYDELQQRNMSRHRGNRLDLAQLEALAKDALEYAKQNASDDTMDEDEDLGELSSYAKQRIEATWFGVQTAFPA